MKYEQYRTELEQIRLTKESKAALIHALEAKQAPQASRSPRRLNRLTLIAAAVAGILVISAGAAVVASPVVRSYFGNSIGYQQSAVELGESITKNGWTMTLTDCAADDYTIYVGVTLTAPEGTVLDNERGYLFEDWFSPDFPELDVAGSGGYMQVEDENPTDNQISFIFTTNLYYNNGNQPLNGQLMELSLGKLYHNTVWNETEQRWERAYDCEEDWTFRTTMNYSDHIIRLEPNLPVHTLDVDATITKVVVSPLTVYVQIESDALKGHHDWVPRTAPDGFFGCVEYQEVTLYTKDGTAIPMTDGTAGSGCSGGTDPTEDGWIRLVRRPDTPLDVEALEAISICGVRIPL